MSERRIITLDDIERRYAITHAEKLEEWVKHIVTLSLASLTILVSLQSNYVPSSPQGLILLQITWIALALCICFGLLVLFGSAAGHAEAGNKLRADRVQNGDQLTSEKIMQSPGEGYSERKIFQISRKLLLASFLVAVVCLTWFSVLNAGLHK